MIYCDSILKNLLEHASFMIVRLLTIIINRQIYVYSRLGKFTSCRKTSTSHHILFMSRACENVYCVSREKFDIINLHNGIYKENREKYLSSACKKENIFERLSLSCEKCLLRINSKLVSFVPISKEKN